MRTTQSTHSDRSLGTNSGQCNASKSDERDKKKYRCPHYALIENCHRLMNLVTKQKTNRPPKKKITKKNSLIKPQSGIALPLVLIFFVVMTLIGVTAIRNATSGEKIAGNVRNHQLAFQAAEQALRFCEDDLQKNIKIGKKSAYEQNILIPISTIPEGVKKAPTCRMTDISDSMELGQTEVSRDESIFVYQITAVGTGPSDNAVVMLQSSLRFKK